MARPPLNRHELLGLYRARFDRHVTVSAARRATHHSRNTIDKHANDEVMEAIRMLVTEKLIQAGSVIEQAS